RIAGEPEAERDAGNGADDEGKNALGQRDAEVLPHGLAEAGIGRAEQARQVDGIGAADDLTGAVSEQLPYAARDVSRRQEEELAHNKAAPYRLWRAVAQDPDHKDSHERLQPKEPDATAAHAAPSL